MKQIFIFGLLGLYTLIAFQSPVGSRHPLVALLQGLDTALGIEMQVNGEEPALSSLDVPSP